MSRFPLLLVLVGGVAVAQPITHPEATPCRVTVVLAPDQVRAEIEAWVRAEPRCRRELEVRVVPTEDGGLYLQARDPAGRIHERVVPDAQSAAVLVVSWMADDSITAPVLVRPDDHAQILRPPVVQEIDREPGISSIAMPTRSPIRRQLTLGALASERSGFRGQLDLVGGSRWKLGIAGGWRGDHDDAVGQARIVLGTERAFGRLSLRAQLGVGVDSSSRHEPEIIARFGDGDGEMDEAHERGVVPAVEAGVFARFAVGNRWGVFGGPLVEASSERGEPALSLMFGVTRGL